MRGSSGQLLILVALLGVWALILVFRQTSVSPAPLASPDRSARPARTRAAQPGELPRLKLELLRMPRPAYPHEVQNIFGSFPPPPAASAAASAPPAGAAPVAAPAPPPPDPFQDEVKGLRYVGFLRDKGRAIAFIVQGQQVYTVEAGGTFLGRFRVQAVQEDAVLLSSLGGETQARLSLATTVAPPPRR